MLNQLWEKGLLSNAPFLNVPHIGLDADYTSFAVVDKTHWLHMLSWHEVFEDNPNLVATNHGIDSLNGRNRNDVLAAQPAPYRRFRQAWAFTRNKLISLVPEEGKPAPDVKFTLETVHLDSAGRPSPRP